MRVVRRTNLTREGWALLAMLAMVCAGGLLRDVNLLIMVGGMLSGPLLFNLVAVRLATRRLEVSRRAPPSLCAGDTLVVDITAGRVAGKVGAWAVAVQDKISRQPNNDRRDEVDNGVLFLYLPVGQSRRAAYRGRVVERGRYRLGPLRVSTRFPFGLAKRTVIVPDYQDIIVCPRLGRLLDASALFDHHVSIAGARARPRRGVQESEFHGLRDWRAGDSRRWIHWRTTARRGALVVKEFEQETRRDAAVVLDLSTTGEPSRRDRRHIERAVSFTATVVEHLCRRGAGRLLLAVSADTPTLFAGAASTALLNEFMQRLAVVRPTSEDQLARLIRRVADQRPRGTPTLIVSNRTREAVALGDDAVIDLDSATRWINAGSDELFHYFDPGRRRGPIE